jgi:3-phenylpropionate/trans-cinnamate dioxygenase ferredoxin subunit
MGSRLDGGRGCGKTTRRAKFRLTRRANHFYKFARLTPRKFLTIDERPIAIFNIKGEFFGLLNRCPHQGAALCEGPLIGLAQSSDPGEIEYTKLGEIIRCPWHGWEFDIRTGQSYCDPKRFRARAYPVNVEPGSAVVKGPYIAETLAVSVESDYVVVDL